MMNKFDRSAVSDLPPILHRSSGHTPVVFGLLVVFAGLCVPGVYLWSNAGKIPDVSATHEIAQVPGLSAEDKETLSDLQSVQQKANEQLAEVNHSIDAQQSDLKRLADQIAVLTSRIESLQNPPTTACVPATPPRPRAVSKPAKMPVRSSQPNGSVPVGGAPPISGASTGQP